MRIQHGLAQTWPMSTGRELERALLINLVQIDVTFLLMQQKYLPSTWI